MHFNPYLAFSGLAYFAGLASFALLAHKQGFPFSRIALIAAAAVVSSLFGAKIFHVLFEANGHALADGTIAESAFDLLRSDPWHWARLWAPGHVLLGAFATAFVALLALLWLTSMERPWRVADLFVPGLALALGIGRIGCYLTGCCFGITQIPIQLIESGFGFAAFAWIISQKKIHNDGNIFIYFILSYALFRFIIEFFRGDLDRGLWFNDTLSTSQMICAFIFFAAAYRVKLG